MAENEHTPYGMDPELWSRTDQQAAVERARHYVESGDPMLRLGHAGELFGLTAEEASDMAAHYRPASRQVEVFDPATKTWGPVRPKQD